MNIIYLLLGSNLGNSEAQLSEARDHIQKLVGNIQKQSSLYQTAAWGDNEQPDFINQVLIVETGSSARHTLETILQIEEQMGRKRGKKNAARLIDIDILFFNDDTIEQVDLIVPHPRIQDRRFVLEPLNELSPGFIHPVFKQPVQLLLNRCTDKLAVKKI